MLFEKVILKVFSKFESVRWAYQYKLYRQKYDLSKSFRFNGKEIVLYGEGKITIGGEHIYRFLFLNTVCRRLCR